MCSHNLSSKTSTSRPSSGRSKKHKIFEQVAHILWYQLLLHFLLGGPLTLVDQGRQSLGQLYRWICTIWSAICKGTAAALCPHSGWHWRTVVKKSHLEGITSSNILVVHYIWSVRWPEVANGLADGQGVRRNRIVRLEKRLYTWTPWMSVYCSGQVKGKPMHSIWPRHHGSWAQWASPGSGWSKRLLADIQRACLWSIHLITKSLLCRACFWVGIQMEHRYSIEYIYIYHHLEAANLTAWWNDLLKTQLLYHLVLVLQDAVYALTQRPFSGALSPTAKITWV